MPHPDMNTFPGWSHLFWLNGSTGSIGIGGTVDPSSHASPIEVGGPHSHVRVPKKPHVLIPHAFFPLANHPCCTFSNSDTTI
jgi:hypothetical protein